MVRTSLSLNVGTLNVPGDEGFRGEVGHGPGCGAETERNVVAS